jgi:hypothetical protein
MPPFPTTWKTLVYTQHYTRFPPLILCSLHTSNFIAQSFSLKTKNATCTFFQEVLSFHLKSCKGNNTPEHLQWTYKQSFWLSKKSNHFKFFRQWPKHIGENKHMKLVGSFSSSPRQQTAELELDWQSVPALPVPGQQNQIFLFVFLFLFLFYYFFN